MTLIRPALFSLACWLWLNFTGPPMQFGEWNIYSLIGWLLLIAGAYDVLTRLYHETL